LVCHWLIFGGDAVKDVQGNVRGYAKKDSGLNLYADGGYSWDSRGGNSLYASAGANYGNIAGGEIGGTLHFDGNWNYQGTTVRRELYISGGPAKLYVGSELGYGGVEGRGRYGGASAFGANIEKSQNRGWNYGVSVGVVSASYNSELGADFNYFGKGLISQVFDEHDVDLPPMREMTEEELKKTDGWFHTNYTGPNKTNADFLTSELDRVAYYHDKAYDKAGVAGFEGALQSMKPMVVAADWKLAGRAFYASTRAISWPNFGGSLGTGVIFTAIATYKTLGMADYRFHKYQY